MSPPWWEAAMLQAISEHDPEQYGGLDWDELTEEQQAQAIRIVLDDSIHQGILAQ